MTPGFYPEQPEPIIIGRMELPFTQMGKTVRIGL